MQVPAIQLDRPGMWAPKILQVRTQMQEATSAPTPPNGRAADVHPAARGAEESAAASPAAAPKQCTVALAALRQHGAEISLSPRITAQVLLKQGVEGAADALQQQCTASKPEHQLESCTETAGPSLKPASSLAYELGPPAKVEPADANLVCEGVRKPAGVRAEPASSAPLQGDPAPSSRKRRRAGDFLGGRKTLSAPLILSSPIGATEEEVTSPANQQAGSAARAQIAATPGSPQACARSQQMAQMCTASGLSPHSSPSARSLTAASADLARSPFTQGLARRGGLTPTAKAQEDSGFPKVASAGNYGAASPSHNRQAELSPRIQCWHPASLSAQPAPAELCTQGSAELAKTRVRQQSRQDPVLRLPPKKAYQKRATSKGPAVPYSAKPTAFYGPLADVKVACMRSGEVEDATTARPAKADAPASKATESVAQKPSPAEQTSEANDQATKAKQSLPKHAPQAAAQQLPNRDGQARTSKPSAQKQPFEAEHASQAAHTAANVKQRKRRGRPLGSNKAAKAKALELAQIPCSPEGKRPVKKSRKALEAEQVRPCFLHLITGVRRWCEERHAC